jgi:hypothetical protein
MTIDLKEVDIHGWHGINLKANVEEKEEDIIAAIKYWDHGDSFLVIVTKDDAFEYGWWLNRYGYPDYDELSNAWYGKDRFIRLPELNGKYDKNSTIANQLYFALDGRLIDHMTYQVKKYRDPQIYFDIFLEDVKKCFDTGTIYHKDDHYFADAYRYLKENDILTEDNLRKLSEMREWLRIDAIDGTAGKKKRDRDDYIYGDTIEWVYYKGEVVKKKFNKHKIKVKSTSDDEWGVSGFSMNLAQFK